MPTSGKNQVQKILYIEDCKEDVEAMQRALAASEHSVDLIYFTSREEGRNFLQKIKESDNSHERPSLIFLDLRIEGISSIDLLQMIKSDPQLKMIPVLILSASEQDSDLHECCCNAATAYIKKPFKLADLKSKVGKALDFWLGVAHQPRQWIEIA